MLELWFKSKLEIRLLSTSQLRVALNDTGLAFQEDLSDGSLAINALSTLTPPSPNHGQKKEKLGARETC